MEAIAVYFQTLQQLDSFRIYIKDRPKAIDFSNQIIYCRCPPEDIEQAKKAFGGKLLKK